MSQKKMSIANFNVVFQKREKTSNRSVLKESPLLEHFDDILMPAFTGDYERKNGDNKYLFLDVKVDKADDGEYVLTGVIVKKTILEVKSDLSHDNQLIHRNDRYSSAPFSIFIIYLKNHRMIFIENQKGSPTLKSFSSLTKYVLHQYIDEKNKKLKEVQRPLLPRPVVNVVGVPTYGKIEEILSQAKKIDKVILRFYPLNGDSDLEYSEIYNNITSEMREVMDSKNAELVFKSPKNIKGVAKVVTQSAGTIRPIFEIVKNDGSKVRVREEQISEVVQAKLDNDDAREEIGYLIEKGKEHPSINYESENNTTTYKNNLHRILSFFK